MITLLLMNLVAVMISVAGAGMCLRATKRTGNHGYLLLAAYFALALVANSFDQIRELERGPERALLESSVGLVGYMDRLDAEALKEAAAAAAVPEEEVEAETSAAADPEPAGDYLPTVSPPVLPALLLVGVYLLVRDDPRRKREEAEPEKETVPANGQEPKSI